MFMFISFIVRKFINVQILLVKDTVAAICLVMYIVYRHLRPTQAVLVFVLDKKLETVSNSL